jgi:hypothetical protein
MLIALLLFFSNRLEINVPAGYKIAAFLELVLEITLVILLLGEK